MEKQKAKRKLKALDFSGSNAAIALVSEDQGGPANGIPTLVIKAANFSDEIIEKASQVKVTMEITEFLQRMFNMWYDDAEVLARALGYTTKEQEEEESNDSYQDYITSKVQSIEVMKQLHEADESVEILSELTEDQYLALIQDQETIEKAFKSIDAGDKGVEESNQDIEKNSDSVQPAKTVKQKVKLVKAEEDTPANGETGNTVNTEGKGVNSSVSKSIKSNKKEKTMTKQATKVVETEVEVIEKSQYEILQKQLQEQTDELNEALEIVKQLKQEKQEAKEAARGAELEKACGKDHAEAIFKAVKEADDETFAGVVKALEAMNKAVEQSELFIEKGASGAAEEIAENPVAKSLKDRLAKKSN